MVLFVSCRHLSGSKYAILGPACNEGTVLTAALTSNYFHLVQVSYAANTPLLSNINGFPLFYRTVPSYLSYQVAVAAVMQYFDWQQVGVIHQEVPYYTTALESLNDHLSNTMPGRGVIATEGLTSHLELDRALEARIFVVMAPENMAAAVMCAAYRLGITGPRYQWILLGDYDEDWWKWTWKSDPAVLYVRPKASCSEQEMLQAIESTLILTHQLQMQRNGEIAPGGLTMDDFLLEFADFFNATEGKQFDFEGATRVASTYDAVWSIALALNRVLITDTQDALENVSFSRRLNSAMEMLTFQGVSGYISFNSSRHSQIAPVTRISQVQNGSSVFVGVHNERDKSLNLSDNSLSWQGASGPPRDRPKVFLATVDIFLVCIMLFFVLLGIILCIVMAVINCYFRKHKVIKASSPHINLLIIAGCFMGFTSVVFISVENIDAHLDVAPKSYLFLCNARPWLLSLGYTLAFGALFAKTWRIYCIFKNPWKKNRPLKDHVLIAIVGVLLGIDIVVLVLWLVLDPLDLHPFYFDSDEEGFRLEEHLVCTGRTLLEIQGADFTIWIIVIMSMKGILLIFGIFLVSQTGKIKSEFFQDARYTGMAIYGVAFCCAGGVPTALILMYNFQEDPGYIIATATIIICSYLILFTVFIPKIVLLKKYRKKVPTAVLIGLNPSFRVRGRVQNRAHSAKQHQYTCQTQQNTIPNRSALVESPAQDTESYSNISVLSNASGHHSNIDLIPCFTGKGDDTILSGWEPAVEHDDSDCSLEVGEAEIQFGDISYIASVVVESEMDRDKKRATHVGEKKRSAVKEEQRHVIADDERTGPIRDYSPSSPILEASRSHFSIDYVTTCFVEVHSDVCSDT